MTQKDNISPKAHLKLHKIGNRYMIVDSTNNNLNITDVYNLNETAAWLWQEICNDKEHTPEELAAGMCKVYNVEYEQALKDINLQLEEWKNMGLL